MGIMLVVRCLLTTISTQESAVLQGWRKQFYIGQAESLDILNAWKNVATHIYTQATCILHKAQSACKA